MAYLNEYEKDSITNNIYPAGTISLALSGKAVDSAHWLTDRQNLQTQVNSLLQQISGNIAAEADFFAQFPDQAYQGYSTPTAPTINDPIPTT